MAARRVLDLTDKFVRMIVKPEGIADRTVEVCVRRDFLVDGAAISGRRPAEGEKPTCSQCTSPRIGVEVVLFDEPNSFREDR